MASQARVSSSLTWRSARIARRRPAHPVLGPLQRLAPTVFGVTLLAANHLPNWWDLAAIVAFSLVIYYWATRSTCPVRHKRFWNERGGCPPRPRSPSRGPAWRLAPIQARKPAPMDGPSSRITCGQPVGGDVSVNWPSSGR
jgi:hypothetical protein